MMMMMMMMMILQIRYKIYKIKKIRLINYTARIRTFWAKLWRKVSLYDSCQPYIFVFCCYNAIWHNAKQNIFPSKKRMECV